MTASTDPEGARAADAPAGPNAAVSTGLQRRGGWREAAVAVIGSGAALLTVMAVAGAGEPVPAAWITGAAAAVIVWWAGGGLRAREALILIVAGAGLLAASGSLEETMASLGSLPVAAILGWCAAAAALVGRGADHHSPTAPSPANDGWPDVAARLEAVEQATERALRVAVLSSSRLDETDALRQHLDELARDLQQSKLDLPLLGRGATNGSRGMDAIAPLAGLEVDLKSLSAAAARQAVSEALAERLDDLDPPRQRQLEHVAERLRRLETELRAQTDRHAQDQHLDDLDLELSQVRQDLESLSTVTARQQDLLSVVSQIEDLRQELAGLEIGSGQAPARSMKLADSSSLSSQSDTGTDAEIGTPATGAVEVAADQTPADAKASIPPDLILYSPTLEDLETEERFLRDYERRCDYPLVTTEALVESGELDDEQTDHLAPYRHSDPDIAEELPWLLRP